MAKKGINRPINKTDSSKKSSISKVFSTGIDSNKNNPINWRLEQSPIDKKLRWGSIIPSISVALIGLYINYYNHDTFRKNLEILPDWVSYLILVVYFFLIFFIQTEYFLRVDPKSDVTKASLSRLSKIGSISNYILVIISISVLFYIYGLPIIIYDFLVSTIFPFLSQELNKLLSNLINWAIAGIVGGYAYKYFVRIVNRYFQPMGKRKLNKRKK